MANNFTLRIWTADEDFTDQDFDSLDELYTSTFDGWENGSMGTAKDPERMQNGWAVYDNDLGTCINSVNAAQCGLDKTAPRQLMTA
jgi:hypothetical protein